MIIEDACVTVVGSSLQVTYLRLAVPSDVMTAMG